MFSLKQRLLERANERESARINALVVSQQQELIASHEFNSPAEYRSLLAARSAEIESHHSAIRSIH
jgi:hypothetical protein